MFHSKAFAACALLGGLVWGQSLPSDQIIHPSADLLPAYHVNAQVGFVDLVGVNGWRPALRFGLGGMAEFEWTRVGYYSDLQQTRQSIPSAGIKLRLPFPVKSIDLALSFYNAQRWEQRRSEQYAIHMDAGYSSVNLSRVDFESTYTRLDLMASWEAMEGFRLYPSLYYLESKSRNLSAAWDISDTLAGHVDSYSDPDVRRNQLVGFGLGLAYAVTPDLTYLAHWVNQPQYHFNVAAKELVLERRNLWVGGIRFRLLKPIVLDVGIYNDTPGGYLSDIQVYSMLNVVVDASKLSPIRSN